jgi:hypothetical protein
VETPTREEGTLQKSLFLQNRKVDLSAKETFLILPFYPIFATQKIK